MKKKKLEDYILKLIIDEYISEPKPVGSVYLINKYNLTISSATVRNIMAKLEQEGMLEKSHTSSGRVPTPFGYEYYAKFLTMSIDEKLKAKIKDIFAKRRSSIDDVIDEAVSIISEISELTVVTSDFSNDEKLKSITLTPINDTSAIIVIITSSGRVDSRQIPINNSKLSLNDLKIAIRIFQERLHDVAIIDIPISIKQLEPILRENIKNYEELIETFVGHVFTSYTKIAHNKVFGKSYIIKSQDIERNQLAHIINLIENQSIWESIDEKNYLEENLKLEIISNNTALISKRLNINGITKEVSVVGPTRMDYSKAKNILNIIEKYANNFEEENKK